MWSQIVEMIALSNVKWKFKIFKGGFVTFRLLESLFYVHISVL